MWPDVLEVEGGNVTGFLGGVVVYVTLLCLVAETVLDGFFVLR